MPKTPLYHPLNPDDMGKILYTSMTKEPDKEIADDSPHFNKTRFLNVIKETDTGMHMTCISGVREGKIIPVATI